MMQTIVTRLSLLPALILFSGVVTPLPLKHTPRPTTKAITVGDLMTRLYIIADDSMQGRQAGSAGHVRATDYIARQAKAIGLVPGGDNGTYFQKVPLFRLYADPASVIISGSTQLRLGRDFILFGNGMSKLSDVPVVYGGTIGDSIISSADAAGKVVVYSVRAFTGFGSLRRPAEADKAAAVFIAVLDTLPDIYRDYLENDGIEVERASPPDMSGLTPTVLVSNAAADKLFATPLSTLHPGAAGQTISGSYGKLYGPVEFPARNVVAILPGSDPRLKTEYVALGAHSDHLGFSHRPIDNDSMRIFERIVRPGGAEDAKSRATPEQAGQVNAELAAYRKQSKLPPRLDSIFNGADDDGSGSAALLEIAQYYASIKPRPKRSIVFVWHVGEEEGMLGSKYFTDHTTIPRDSIVAQLNVDMIGRGDAGDRTGTDKQGAPLNGNSRYLQLVGSRRLSTELGDIVERVNKQEPDPFIFDYSMDANGHPQMIYCRSDHYAYARFNIPVVFFTTGGHADYHQVTDEPAYIDYDHYLKATRLIADVGTTVANLDHRPLVDKPAMSGAACVQ